MRCWEDYARARAGRKGEGGFANSVGKDGRNDEPFGVSGIWPRRGGMDGARLAAWMGEK